MIMNFCLVQAERVSVKKAAGACGNDYVLAMWIGMRGIEYDTMRIRGVSPFASKRYLLSLRHGIMASLRLISSTTSLAYNISTGRKFMTRTRNPWKANEFWRRGKVSGFDKSCYIINHHLLKHSIMNTVWCAPVYALEAFQPPNS